MRSLAQLMDLRGRTALITGGAGHIGRAAATALAELGARVVLVDLPASEPQAAADEIQRTYGPSCIGITCDLADTAQIQALPSRLSSLDDRLDVVINAAALVGTSALTGWVTPFLKQSEDAWRKALDVNLTAPFLITQALATLLKASGHGSIINVASIHGLVGPVWSLYEGTQMGNPAAYAASKGGLLQLTRWLAATLAPEIRVNAITPGGILRGQPTPFVDRYEQRTPLGRMGNEEDLKGAIAYLASDLSAYVTGQNVVIDGGWTAL
jgi:NAD(P)-dependent dehydrogenase (short-subunit alcohol dehydrogenase family)